MATRRMPPFIANSIGLWSGVMTFISYTAVVVNGCVIAFSSRFIEKTVYRSLHNGTLAGYIDQLTPQAPGLNCSYVSLCNEVCVYMCVHD